MVIFVYNIITGYNNIISFNTIPVSGLHGCVQQSEVSCKLFFSFLDQIPEIIMNKHKLMCDFLGASKISRPSLIN